jgi:predicted membrane protein
MSRTVWTVIGVIVAVIVAWFLVDVLFSLLWFIAKLAIVAVVAVVAIIVFFVLRNLVRRSDDHASIER